ncbi:Uncharacterised protein [Chlamydia abortus]|nr:Uncharacterised protein [Chlamydia abortus]
MPSEAFASGIPCSAYCSSNIEPTWSEIRSSKSRSSPSPSTENSLSVNRSFQGGSTPPPPEIGAPIANPYLIL